MAIMVGQVTADITGDPTGFNRAIDGVRRKGASVAQSVQQSFRNVGRRMQSIGQQMTAGLTLPLVGAGALAVKAAADYENAFADVRKTVNATEKQFNSISKELRSLSNEIPTSAEELARMAGVAGQLGVKAQNIVEFTETIAMLGDTTDIAGEQAALSLSRFMNIMGTAQSDINRLGSAIVGLGNNFAAMESEIIQISTSLAPLGNMVGLTEQQVLAFATTMAASGANAEAAATSFQRIASTMKTAVLTGNQDLQTFANTAGITANEFKEAFQNDAAQAITLFLKGLRSIQEQGGSTTQVLEDLTLADQRLQREVGKVIGNLGQLDEALSLSNQEWAKATALTEEAEKRYSTLTSLFGILKNNVRDLGRQIGASLIDTFDIKGFVKEFTASIQNAMQWFNSLSQEVRRNAFIIAGILGASGPIIAALGTLSLAIGAISAPIAGVVAAFAAGAVAIASNWDSIVDYFTSGGGARVWDSIKFAASGLWDSLVAIFEVGKDLVMQIWESWGQNAFMIAQSAFSAVLTIAGSLFKGLAAVLNLFAGNWKRSWINIVESAAGIMRTLQPALGAALTAQAELMKAELDGQKKLVEDFAKDVKEITANVETPDVNISDSNVGTPDTGGSEISIPTKFVPPKKPIDEVINDLPSLEEMTQGIDLSVPDKMFPPGSLGAMRERMTMLREQLSFATDPAIIARLKNEIGLTREQINQLTGNVNNTSAAMQQFGQIAGQALSQAVLHGNNLLDVLKNIAKQLASRALIDGITALLGGGPIKGVLGGIGKLFGGIFHSGGIVPGSGERLILAQGGEGVFTPGQMAALGNMRSQPSSGQSTQKAFENALRNVVTEVSPSRVFELSEKGKKGF